MHILKDFFFYQKPLIPRNCKIVSMHCKKNVKKNIIKFAELSLLEKTKIKNKKKKKNKNVFCPINN